MRPIHVALGFGLASLGLVLLLEPRVWFGPVAFLAVAVVAWLFWGDLIAAFGHAGTFAALVLAAVLIGGALYALGGLRRAETGEVWAKDVPHWRSDALPLSVHVADDFGAHRASVVQAVDEFNARVGCQIFATSEKPDQSRVLVRNEACATLEPGHRACAWRHPDGLWALIQIGQPGTVSTSYIIAYHELGHVIGLADAGPWDVQAQPLTVPIMADNAPAHAWRLGQGLSLPRLSDARAAAVRARYCR